MHPATPHHIPARAAAAHNIAAIVYAADSGVDAVLAGIATALRAQGIRLGGVIQHNRGACALPGFAMELEDLATGRIIPISEDRGAGAHACRLDACGLTEGAAALVGALAGAPALVIVNKFGRQEAAGGGLRSEIAASVLAGIPLLTAVRADLVGAWQDFAGEEWDRLPPDSAAILDWCRAQVALPAATALPAGVAA